MPSEAMVSAPILVQPDAATLAASGAKTAVVVGAGKRRGRSGQPLRQKQRLEVPVVADGPRGEEVRLIVMNPHNADATLDPNVQWPYLSLAAAPLAAYSRRWCKRATTPAIASSCTPWVALGNTGDKAEYQSVKPNFPKVRTTRSPRRSFSPARPDAAVPRHGRRLDRAALLHLRHPRAVTNTGIPRSTTCPPTRPTPRCGPTWITRGSSSPTWG